MEGFKQLIPVYEKQLDGSPRQMVSARDLHEFLEVGRDFTNWIKARIKKYGFVEQKDFSPVLAKTTEGRPATEYYITLDMAKELSMVENNSMGRIARRYFIEVENKARKAYEQQKNLSPAEFLLQQAQMMVNHEKRIEQLEAKVTTRPEYFTIAGFARLNGFTIGMKEAASVGRRATQICKEFGYPIETTPDVRWGLVNTYPASVLSQIFTI